MNSFFRAAAILVWLAPAALAQVVISEIHYHPVEEPVFNADGTPALDLTDDVHEFIELQNTGATAVSLGGWSLSGGVSFTVPAGVSIPAGGFKVFARNPARIEFVYALPAGSVLGPWSGKLGNDGDTVKVRDAAGALVEEVDYSGHFPWAESANALGAQDRFTGLNSAAMNYRGRSLQRVSVTAGGNDPANWLASPLSGPTPGGPQAVTRAVPRPVVLAQSRVQVSNGASIIRAGQQVAVTASFSSTQSLSQVQVEYFSDDVNSTSESRSSLPMTAAGNGIYTAVLPAQADRSIVRYRFKANRGDGVETVSPRPDDPQIAPTALGGALEAWHGYFVTPARTSANAVYDVLIGSTQLTQIGTNISQSERRVTVGTAAGVPREVPWVPATAPLWNGTQPAVFACDGEIRDIQMRYHGSRYHRAVTNHSYKIHFPENQPFRGVTSFFITGHASNTAETQKMYRLLDLPASLTRTVDWYLNSAALESRLEHGEYERHVLEEWTARQQQLNPGSAREDTGEFYKAIGNINASQNNTEGPYTKADEAPMLANANWTQLQRYEWTFSLQNNAWKGHRPFRDMVEGMWLARGDTPGSANFANNPVSLAAAKAWFQTNFDVDATLTAMAICQWAGIWDDTGHNQFFWRRANGRWVRLPWDFDDTLSAARASQSIYSNEQGVNTFNGPNWWKDTFFKCFRSEFKQRLWELNNSFLDAANLTANGLTTAASFAATRQANVNTQVGLGTFSRPARPANTAPAAGAAVVGGAVLTGSTYSHPAGRPHAKSKWEIRLASGDFEEPEVRVTSQTDLTSFTLPLDQLTYGQSYSWRVTYFDADGHASVVSPETGFTYGTGSTAAGTLVLNEVLANNRSAVENGGAHPDYVELRNNGTASVSLTGLALTDDPLVPARYVFPAGISLAAGASLVVWCDSATASPGLHTGFGLDAGGQTLLLLNGSAILDAVTFGPQAPDISIGRIVNGTGGWQANVPTPGAANTAAVLGNPAILRINEWMAAPAYGEDWFEVHNPGSSPVSLGGLYLSDDPAEPAKTRLPALSFIAAGGFTKLTADDSAAGGSHMNFKLGGGGDNLVLTAATGVGTIDLVSFGPQAADVSSGRVPDGSATTSAFPQSGSPGSPNWLPATVVINEALANSTAPFVDRIELFNAGPEAVAMGGWWLSDDRTDPRKFQIPAGTAIPAGGYAVFDESQFNSGARAFSLSSLGDEVVLSAVDAGGVLTGYRALVSFGATGENVSLGRVSVAGGGNEFWPLTGQSFGAVNAAPKTTPLLINEVMYHPPDAAGGADDTANEFIEIHNPGAEVSVAGWRLKGDSDYNFPSGAVIDAGAYVLLLPFDPANTAALQAFRSHYGITASTPVFGPYSGKLSNSTQNLELAQPGAPVGGEVPFINVDKVEYRDTAPWDGGADGTGSSLQRKSRLVIGNDGANWSAAVPTPGAINAGVIGELTIFTASPLPGAVTGLPYSYPMSAAGGNPPYAWSITGGTLPQGLLLSPEGVLSGSADYPGDYAFTVQVKDASDEVRVRDLTLTVAATALQISTLTLPNGVFGQSYSQSLTAVGGNPGYTWSVSSGALPGGLSLSNAGVLAGTPSAPGVFTFTLRVDDAGALTVSRSYTITVPVPPLTIVTGSSLPAGVAGTPYAQSLLAAGGTAPYTWTLASGSLPGGITLSPSGDLTGVPGTPGSYSFSLTLTDAAATVRSRAFTLTITPAPLVIETGTALPGGIAGDAYSTSVASSGGTLPYAWSLTAGTLPPGLVLSGNGLLSGIPSAAGTYSFTLQNQDAGGQSASKAFLLTVASSGPVHHLTWDYLPAAANAGTPFAARLTARDQQGRLAADYNGSASISAAQPGAALPSPVVITEVTNETEDQFELQNVSGATVDATGWFVRIGDNTASINTMNSVVFTLPAALSAGAMVRVSETNTAGRTWFGGAIGWNTTTPRGWIMLFDAAGSLRDFFALGWTAADIAGLSVTVNGRTVTAAGHWSGAGAVQGTLGNITSNTDSWQRFGTADSNAVSDWQWVLNGSTLGATNAQLTLPWNASTPLTLAPASVPLLNGEWTGYLTVSQTASSARFTAAAGSALGEGGPVAVGAALVDSDSDGIPDAYETAHGLNAGTADGAADADRDGASNYAEYRFGTDPQSAGSLPAIQSVVRSSDGGLTIQWPAAAGVLYRIASSTDAQNWSYTPWLATGSGMAEVTIEPGTAPRLMMRVEVAP